MQEWDLHMCVLKCNIYMCVCVYLYIKEKKICPFLLSFYILEVCGMCLNWCLYIMPKQHLELQNINTKSKELSESLVTLDTK